MACVGVENSERASKEMMAQGGTEASKNLEVDTKGCDFSAQLHDVQGPEVVRLMEPPFMVPKESIVLPQDQVMSYATEPYVLQYQVVRVDVSRFLEFLYREAEIENKECAAKVLLKIFDEEPIEIYRDTVVVFRKTTSSIRGAWVGKSKEGTEFSFQFVLESIGGLTMSIRSESKVFQVNRTDALPYHVLWEWDTEFFGPSGE